MTHTSLFINLLRTVAVPRAQLCTLASRVQETPSVLCEEFNTLFCPTGAILISFSSSPTWLCDALFALVISFVTAPPLTTVDDVTCVLTSFLHFTVSSDRKVVLDHREEGALLP